MIPSPSANKLASIFIAVVAVASIASPLAAQVPQMLNYQGRVAVDGTNFDGSGQFKFALVDGGTNTSRTATAIATVMEGLITGVTVIDGGAGYLTAPTAIMREIKGSGSGAVLSVTVADGAVTAITVVNHGLGYGIQASVRIGVPPANIVYQTFWRNSVDTTPADGEPDAAVPLSVARGLYSVLLGDSTLPNMAVLPATIFTNPDVRLRVWFDDGTHGFQLLSPDQRIAAVGYAMMATTAQSAQSADTVVDGAITTAKLATGAVQSGNIAVGAVTSTQLAANAVQSANIAAGAITAAQLAKPPRSGTLASTSLSLQFNQATFSVPFSPAFATNPIVTLAARTNSATQWQPSLWVTSTGTASFSGSLVARAEPLTLDSAVDAGRDNSLAVINGNPAIAYYDATNGNLKFIRATTPSGAIWGTPVTLDSTGDVGKFPSLITLPNGAPGVAYYDATNGDLKFVSGNAEGSTWYTPVTVASTGDVGTFASMAVAGGYPAIAYYDFTNGDLNFVRSNDTSGSAWGTPVTLDSTGDVGRYVSLAVIGALPSVAYYDTTNFDLKFIRANNTYGSTWGSPLVVDGTGMVGNAPSLASVNGNPAISYFDWTNSDLKFVRATTATGSAWATPLTLDSVGNVGLESSLVVIEGNPAVAYYDLTNSALKYVRASAVDGTTWGTPVTLDSTGNVGNSVAMAVVNGNPAVAYYDWTNYHLKFLRAPDMPAAFNLDWIALEP